MRIQGSIRLAVATAAVLGVVETERPLAQEATAGSTAIIARGAELYAAYCPRCHNPRGPAERTDREWIIVMQHMETRANMTRGRAAAVRAFLLASNDAARLPGSARTTLAPTPRPEDVDQAMLGRGRLVFQGAGGCAACHGANLGGTPIAPSLRDATWKRGDGSLSSILNIVRNGVIGTAMAPYPGGITDEMAVDAAAFAWAVSQGRVQP